MGQNRYKTIGDLYEGEVIVLNNTKHVVCDVVELCSETIELKTNKCSMILDADDLVELSSR